jgi:hypothetical protein
MVRESKFIAIRQRGQSPPAASVEIGVSQREQDLLGFSVMSFDSGNFAVYYMSASIRARIS